MMENKKIKDHAISMLDMGYNEMKLNNPVGAAYALGAYEAYRTVYEKLTGINLNKMGRIYERKNKLSDYVNDHDNL